MILTFSAIWIMALSGIFSEIKNSNMVQYLKKIDKIASQYKISVEQNKMNHEDSWNRTPTLQDETILFWHNGTDYEKHEFWNGKLMFINDEMVAERKNFVQRSQENLVKSKRVKTVNNEKLISMYEQPVLINDSI